MRLGALIFSLFLVTACNDRKASADPPATAPTPATHAPAAQPEADPQLPSGIVNLKELRDDEKKSFYKMIQKFPSACGKAHSLEVSLKSDPGCRRSVYAARYIVHLLSLHLLESEAEEHYEARFGPQQRVTIDTAGAPMLGDAHAPITLVEFSDFQCPHCKKAAPILERIVLEEYRGQVKLFYKSYPLSSHPDAKVAAQAAMAAGKQGKFWPYFDKIYGGDLEKEDMTVLEKYAKDLKLDLKKWHADLDAMKPVVEKDRSDGEKLEVSATPTIYINGRLYRGPHNYDEMKDWIDEELNR
jgi:predicted DsbA family dithiol-disulfide isomerase